MSKNKKKVSPEEEFDLALSDILKTRSGRKVIWHYLAFCRVFGSVFAPMEQMCYNEGMRNVGLRMLTDMQQASPDSYLQMIKEQQNDEEKNDGRRNDNDNDGD